MLAVAVPTLARAGSGPWVVSEGSSSVYFGGEYQRLTRLTQSSGASADDVIDVDDGLETTGVKAVVSVGIRDDVELELDVPWTRVDANRTDGPICAALGRGTCATTRGLGVVGTRVKWLVLDELYGSPMSVSVGALARFGTHTAPTRARVTNLGEGTTDLGPTLAVGRSGGLGKGFWSAHVDGSYRYRFPNVVDAQPPVPGSEYTVDAELLAGARAWWSIGPQISWWHRPQGVDLEDILADPALATDIDRFARLRASSLRVGGKLLVRSSTRTTLVLGATSTVAAVNNPLVFSMTAGLNVVPRVRSLQGGQGG